MNSLFSEAVTDHFWLFYERPDDAWDILLPLIRNGVACVTISWCELHQRRCDLCSTEDHSGGTPCVDFTPNNTFKYKERGASMLTLACFYGQRAILQEDRFTHENVHGVAKYVVSALFDMYFCDPKEYQADINPASLGFANERSRTFLNCVHRVKCLPAISPLAQFSRRFHRAVAHTWRDYFFMREDDRYLEEVRSDLKWAQQRKTSFAKTHPWDSHGATSVGYSSTSRLDVFLCALTKGEQKHLRAYKHLFGDEQVMMVSQNPVVHPQYSRNGMLHTIVHNVGLNYTERAPGLFSCRWQIGSELLFAMGFRTHHASIDSLRVFPDLGPINSFVVPRRGRTAYQMRKMAGNSMNVMSMLVAKLHGVTQCPRAPLVHPRSEHHLLECFAALSSVARAAQDGREN